MIILDENFPDSQRQILKGWRVPFKQVAFEIGREGIKDMGKVINVSYAGLIIWELHATDSVRINWQSDDGQTGDRRYTHRR